MPTHPKTTRHGCVAQARTQLAQAPVANRSCAARRSASGSGGMVPVGVSPPVGSVMSAPSVAGERCGRSLPRVSGG
jgi:hypothetical protein